MRPAQVDAQVAAVEPQMPHQVVPEVRTRREDELLFFRQLLYDWLANRNLRLDHNVPHRSARIEPRAESGEVERNDVPKLALDRLQCECVLADRELASDGAELAHDFPCKIDGVLVRHEPHVRRIFRLNILRPDPLLHVTDERPILRSAHHSRAVEENPAGRKPGHHGDEEDGESASSATVAHVVEYEAERDRTRRT